MFAEHRLIFQESQSGTTPPPPESQKTENVIKKGEQKNAPEKKAGESERVRSSPEQRIESAIKNTNDRLAQQRERYAKQLEATELRAVKNFPQIDPQARPAALNYLNSIAQQRGVDEKQSPFVRRQSYIFFWWVLDPKILLPLPL